MKHFPTQLAAAASLATLAAGLTQQCTGKAVEEGGNYFCGAVDQILYQGIGKPGTYEAVTGMTPSGQCQRETKSFQGPLAPFDEGLSIHFRGPLYLKEFAVYTPSQKTKRAPSPQQQRREQSAAHGHQRFHDAQKQKQRRGGGGEMVTATIDGKVVSWKNNWFGGGPATSTAPAAAPAAPTPPPPPPPPALPKSKPPPPPAAASGKDWDRTSYYSAEAQQADNLVFLGNYGGAGSGKFDNVWGNSLAFLNAQGSGGASSSQILANVTVPSNKEFSIFSGSPCDSSCGFSRAEDVAYKGFEGANKIFLFHFSMPIDGNRDVNGDTPAIWALNAHIPRAAQYHECSCWPACGEFDFFEVLAAGDAKCKSTVHLAAGAGAGGSSDYFRRPTAGLVKAAVVFAADAGVSVRLLPPGADFAAGLDAETVRGWMATGGDNVVSSLFQVAGGLLG